MQIQIVEAYAEKDAVRNLFTEYTDALIRLAPAMADYLAAQNLDAELADLEVKYGKPHGRMPAAEKLV
ncbi:MAG: hypothetical protein ACTTKL_08355 [Treponema sp.]